MGITFNPFTGQFDITGTSNGTVTSIGITDSTGILTVTGSPVTGSGNITLGLASEAANTVLAAPNGTTGTPSFRSLVATDIPSLSAVYVTQSEVAQPNGVASLDVSGKVPSAQIPTINAINQLTGVVTAGPVSGSTSAVSSFNSGAATSAQALFANGTSGAAYRSITAGDIPSLSYANPALSNLASTAVNADIVPATTNLINLGTGPKAWAGVATVETDFFTPTGTFSGAIAASSGNLTINTNNDLLLSPSGKISLTGTFVQTSTKIQPSSDLTYDLGTSILRWNNIYTPNLLSASSALTINSGGNNLRLRNGSEGTAGQVWTSTDTVGSGSWSAPVATTTNNKELFTLSSTNITNQFIDLAHVALTNSIEFLVQGGSIQIEGASFDYSVSYTGGIGSNTRITFLNGLATGGTSALVAGDVVIIKYQY